MKSRLAIVINVIHLLALIAWLAAMVSAGIAAMNVFGTLPDLGVEFPRFAALSPEEQARTAAGMIMQKVFHTVDTAQLWAASVAFLTLVIQIFVLRFGFRGFLGYVRIVSLLVAITGLGLYLVAYVPRMNVHLHDYWTAAENNQPNELAQHSTAFDDLHHKADYILRQNIIVVVIALTAFGVILQQGSSHNPISRSELT